MGGSNGVSELTLSELEPYVLGKEFLDKPIEMPRCTQEVFDKFMQMIAEDNNAATFLETFEVPKDFYDTLPDFKHEIPKDFREEVFYAGKLGKMYTEVPSECVYILMKAWSTCNGIPNLLLKTVPIAALNKWFRKGYFLGAVSLKDVICNVCTPLYRPLCETRLTSKVGNFTEVYVKKTDMVAALPNKLADALDTKSILEIDLGPNGLEINGVLLRTMAGYVGAINSYYDLRELI